MFKSLKISEIYASQLVHLGYGHPLWYPEPDLVGEIKIGDVGYIDDGKFIRLFNACRTERDGINTKRGVPGGFVPLKFPDEQILKQDNIVNPGKPLRSDSVQEAKFNAGAGVSMCVQHLSMVN